MGKISLTGRESFPPPALDPAEKGRFAATFRLACPVRSAPIMSKKYSAVQAVLAALAVGGAGGCVGMTPPAQNAGPALSDNGIQVAVVRQSCSQTPEPDDDGWDLVEANIEVQVRNGAPGAATVQRDRFRLLAPDGSALKTMTWGAADPLTVAGGASQTFDLRFMTHGGLECAKEMRLDLDSGIKLGESPVAFQPVAFTPERAL